MVSKNSFAFLRILLPWIMSVSQPICGEIGPAKQHHDGAMLMLSMTDSLLPERDNKYAQHWYVLSN